MRSFVRALLAAAALVAAVPGVASADNTLTISQGDAVFRSEDAGVNNQFVIEDRGAEVRFYEPVDSFGINTNEARCRPGETRGSIVVEYFCAKALVNRSITVEAGPGEDSVTYNVGGVPGTLSGETGADKLTSLAASNDFLTGDQGNDTLDAGPGDDEARGEDGNDTISTGDGNDKVFGGNGEDTIDTGAGDDSIQTPDGLVDKVACGAGTDAIIADTIDELTDCENPTRQFVAPPADSGAGGNDTTRPLLKAGGSTSQRVTRRRRTIRIAVTSSEKGEIAATGFISVGGINRKLKPSKAVVTVAGGGVTVKIKLSRSLARRVMRAARRGRRPWARITVSAVDAAGNTSTPKRLRVYLRR